MSVRIAQFYGIAPQAAKARTRLANIQGIVTLLPQNRRAM
jgi:hypothetical protein